MRRHQAQIAAVLEQNDVSAVSLAVLHDTGTEVVYGLTVPWPEALAWWRRLRALVEQTGYWPVLLDEDLTANQLIADLEAGQDRPVAAILHTSEGITPRDIFERWRPYDDADLGRRSDEVSPWPDEGGSVRPRRSYFEEPDPLAGSRAMPPPVVLALAPTRLSWEVPAIFRWGGPHGCPDPEEQVVVLRDWHERYGADVVALFPLGLELHAQRMPTTREEALMLAREQLAYCHDIEDARSVEDLAKILVASRVWRFRWE